MFGYSLGALLDKSLRLHSRFELGRPGKQAIFEEVIDMRVPRGTQKPLLAQANAGGGVNVDETKIGCAFLAPRDV